MAESKVVAATGVATLGRGDLGKLIEAAMSSAILEASKEADAIYADKTVPYEERHKKIAAIMDPNALRERKLAARAKVKEFYRQREAEQAKKADK